jgi:hypothetical protein
MKWAIAAALAISSSIVGTAAAAPIEFVEQRDQYMIFADPDGSVEYANWFERDPFLAGYAAVEEGFLAAHDDDSQFIVIYTTFTLPEGVGALYQSVANDIEGIGYDHAANDDPVIPAEIFDDTPNSQVFGFMHMNVWTQYLGGDRGGVNDNLISLIFGQELGHAWLAFPYANGVGDGMLGRSNAHWSFYLDSGGSPVEGHDWVDNGDGTFTAIKHDIYEYSDLDLYLMGLLPADDVAPWFLLQNPSNCVDSAQKDGSCAPPEGFLFQAESYTVNANRVDITIDDVIAAEGERVPAWPDAPDEYDVSFLLITRSGEVLDEGQKALMDAIIERSIDIFDAQTRGYAHIVNRTSLDPPGDDTGTDDGPDSGVDDSGSGDDAGTSGASATGASASATDPGDGGTAPTTMTGADSSGTGDAGEDEAAEGCGCAGERSGAMGIGGLVLAAIARRRRRSAV